MPIIKGDSETIVISLDVARRFILGKQGLWPGRRWRGKKGTEQAMQAIEYLQLDPLQIIARSHDITLHSRVLDYVPAQWEEVTYQQRKFFDWGGWLAARSMDELPHWRVVMRRERDDNTRIRAMAREHAEAIVEMRTILRERDVVSNRDFEMATRTRTQSYRGRKDSALALYYLRRVAGDEGFQFFGGEFDDMADGVTRRRGQTQQGQPLDLRTRIEAPLSTSALRLDGGIPLLPNPQHMRA